MLFQDGKQDSFESGDLLLVDAGIEHPFEDISDELAVRRIFDGPRGCEVSAKRVLSGGEKQYSTVPTLRVIE